MARRILTTLAVLVFILASVFLFLSAIESWSTDRTRRGWARTFGTPEEIVERYPHRAANAAALRIEGLIAELGIDIATRIEEGRDRPTQKDRNRFSKVKFVMGTYLTTQLERSDRNVDPPPERLRAFLDAHRAGLDALTRQLVAGESPRWELRIEHPVGAPLPNLLGHIDMHKLFIADVLVNVYSGDDDRAVAGLEASWRLNQALRNDPILITQLVWIAGTRMQAGALRHFEHVDPVWRERLAEREFRASFLEAMRYEGWHWTQIGAPAAAMSYSRFTFSSPWKRAVEIVAKPYVRWCLADTSEKFRRRLENLTTVEVFCDEDLAGRHADMNIPIPRWNLFGEQIVPSIAHAVDRVARLELDLEMTAKLLEADAARRANGGRWPLSLPGIEESSACPADRWIYNVAPEGAMTLAFSREISWPGQTGAVLPTRFGWTPD